jgi:hypothetical protein
VLAERLRQRVRSAPGANEAVKAAGKEGVAFVTGDVREFSFLKENETRIGRNKLRKYITTFNTII